MAAGATVAAKMIKAVFHWDGAVQSPWQQVPVANRKEQQEEHKNIKTKLLTGPPPIAESI